MSIAVADLSPTDCRRFVLPADAPYIRNLAALWTMDHALAAAIDSLPPDARYEVEPSRSGALTVAVEPKPGRKLYLHSRYEPLPEAKKLADEALKADPMGFYIHGFGLGYHVREIFDRASDSAILCIFEPDIRLLRTAFEHQDYSTLIDSRRVLFFTQPDKSDLMTRLTPQTALLSLGTTSVNHAPSIQAAPEFHQQFQTWTAEFASFMRTSLNTLVLNGRRTAENISRNLGAYVASPSLARLKDRHRGRPAIIVSAGPSLRKNKHLLKDAADRGAVIIAVQTTLRPLLEMGVEPDYVTSLDYHDICTRFFENLPPTLKCELIAEPKAASKVLAMYPGPVSILGNDYAESLLRELKLAKTCLPSGATVAHLAFYAAEHVGCDPIVFVGQDLGFSDGLCYAPGTSYEDVWRPEFGPFCTVEMKQWEQIVRDRHILRRIPDHQGRPMYTEERLFTYLQQFERDFARCKSRVIDASEGGAAKRGVTYMTLQQVIAEHCTHERTQTSDEKVAPDRSRIGEATASLQRRSEEAQNIARIARETLPLLEEIRDHLSDQGRVNRAIARVDLLRSQMNEFGATYDLIMQLTQQTELNRFTADRRLSDKRLSANEKQRKQVERDVENVRGVIEASEAFIRLMEEASERLSD